MREDPAGGLPAGFRAAGVAAGIKPSGGTDVGLLVSDAPETTSAARFTRSGVLAAPVLVTRERSRLDALRVVVANSGNANAATGGRGLDDAAKMQGAAAMAGGVRGRPGRRRLDRRHRRAARLARGGQRPGARALRAAPRRRRRLRRGDHDHRRVREAREPRGRRCPAGPCACARRPRAPGMISPAFATMLCFVQTDAALAAETADLLLGVCVKRSFDRISVDGQLSTNDTAILMCSGASGVRVEPESEDELRFGQALDALLRQLALDDRARRRGRQAHRPRRRARRPRRRASRRPRARSPTRRWSRRRCTAATPTGGASCRRSAMALPGTAPLAVDVGDRGRAGVRRAAARSPSTPGRWRRRWRATRSSTSSSCRARAHETEVFFSDLSHEYVTINAEYTT